MYEINKIEAFDIDDVHDFAIVQKILKKMNIKTFYKYFLKKIELKLRKKKKINVMVTGGKSITKLYHYINTNLSRELYKKINFFITDERDYSPT